MRIVTFRWARDAMAAGWHSGDPFTWTKRRSADGEIVWSWRRDPGVYLAGSIPPTTVTTKAAHRGELV